MPKGYNKKVVFNIKKALILLHLLSNNLLDLLSQ